jgi:transposase
MTRKSYPTDLLDVEWENIAHLVPPPKTGGRPRTYSNRELLNAIFYHVRADGSWRCLPHDYPPSRSKAVQAHAESNGPNSSAFEPRS